MSSHTENVTYECDPPQCSHQNLQAKGHKYYLMTTPIILNVVICQYQTFAACVLLSTKHFSSVQCSLSSIFRAQTVQVVQVGVKNMLVLRWNPLLVFWVDPKGTLGAPKDTVPFGKGLARTLTPLCENRPLGVPSLF